MILAACRFLNTWDSVKRPTSSGRPLDNVNLNINVLITTPDESPTLLKDHISGAKGMVPQEGVHSSKTSSAYQKHLSNIVDN